MSINFFIFISLFLFEIYHIKILNSIYFLKFKDLFARRKSATAKITYVKIAA
ncbi:hypothetical protein CAMGR0001_0571 [Campylobacter gracilis RM3268]|uniref:Uncharacterized protein n=1 Tax=Campylobacter gracilis RM3268 TaxID=553220 RepID=C8PHX5_9BACT|nr:hypothetical protein CAMGR0001_0571 [Campylobacter gracilis RM3268]